MKNSLILIFSCSLIGLSNVSSGQNNNSNTGSEPQTPPTIINSTPQNSTVPPVPSTQGTEPNNRVMLKSQTDSMDSKRGTKPNTIRMTGDTIGTDRTKMRNDNPVVNPVRRDSIK